MNTSIIKNVKYLSLVVGGTNYGEYLSKENINSFKKLARDEPPINFTKGVKYSTSGCYEVHYLLEKG